MCMSKDVRAYAVKQDVVDYNAENLMMLQAQLINKDYVGKVMVEKVSKDAGVMLLESITFLELL